MRIGILDDEQSYRDEIKAILETNFPDITAQEFPTVKALLKTEENFDLVLLDIEMPQMNGLDFAHKFRGRFTDIVFVTSHDEFVYDSFLGNVHGYVLKDNLEESLIKEIKKFQARTTCYIDLPLADGNIRIDMSKILYFYTKNSLCYVVTNKGTQLLNVRSLQKLKLHRNFYQVSRQSIVNLAHIQHFYKVHFEIGMSNGDRILVGRRRWNDVLAAYTKEMII